VVATGFDATYFANRSSKQLNVAEQAQEESTSSPKQEETDVSDLNMELDANNQVDETTHDFHSEPTIPNIWSLDHDAEHEPEAPDDFNQHNEEELEKPSFLRRLKKRRSDKDNDAKTDRK
jgi:hypothetical protein